jgi:hypothetical protein
MRVTSLAFAALGAIMLFAAPVRAADPAPNPAREACAADFAKFCAGQDPSSDTGRACMREHRAQVSETCRAARDVRRQERHERIKTACAADIAKFCNAGSSTDDSSRRCLRDHKDELSANCKAAFPNRGS